MSGKYIGVMKKDRQMYNCEENMHVMAECCVLIKGHMTKIYISVSLLQL